jgi:glycogen synthase
MKIALVSYEYPPDTLLGGIGTYAFQAAEMLADAGHEIHVFAGSSNRTGRFNERGVVVHRLATDDRAQFPHAIAELFVQENKRRRFDVLEGPEYGTEARICSLRVPDMPHVVKLHTPKYLIDRTDAALYSLREVVEAKAKSVARRILRRPAVEYQYTSDPEYAYASGADVLVSPSRGLRHLVSREWDLQIERIEYIPNAFNPSPALLEIEPNTAGRQVTFFGRVTPRKGIFEFIKAAKIFLRRVPTATVRIAGWPRWKLRNGEPIEDFIRHELAFAGPRLTGIGPVSQSELPSLFKESAIVALPSYFENFPNTCLEAMSAGRAIIGSVNGGMRDQLDDGRCGILVDPRRPKEIADGVVKLLETPELRVDFGTKARHRVLHEYSPAAILPLHLASYQKAIDRRSKQSAGPIQSHLKKERITT